MPIPPFIGCPLVMMDDQKNPFSTVEQALKAIKEGRMVIVADDEDRENEGDFVCAAEKITPELINMMATEGRGLICLTLTDEVCERLNLQPMVANNGDPMGTAFTVSIDGHPKFGVSTGISASDRAKTILITIAPDAVPTDLQRPGHIFPLKAKPAGVLERVGQTEASVDLARLAGLKPAGVICEIMNPDGTMARRPQLEALATRLDIPFITVAQLIAYRLQQETLVTQQAQAQLPTEHGIFTVYGYQNVIDNTEHMALVFGDLAADDGVVPLVRVHSECVTGDLLGSLRCDCGTQLHQAMAQIAQAGKGVLVYLRNQEGRGIGLINKLKAYQLQDKGFDTVDANRELGFPPDLRQYGTGAQILRDLGIAQFNLLTNNPRKLKGLEGYGLQLVNRVPLVIAARPENAFYLQTKKERLGHLID
jgi:3,4-dihydroxy 2-butanone 4-phosphate synthase / GTP cyclohydrolase II